MTISEKEKNVIKRAVARALSREKEVKRVVVFGSFVSLSNPNDLDIAVFQDSSEPYLPLAMRYRKDVRQIARRIPIDIIPLRAEVPDDPFLADIKKGETVYER